MRAGPKYANSSLAQRFCHTLHMLCLFVIPAIQLRVAQGTYVGHDFSAQIPRPSFGVGISPFVRLSDINRGSAASDSRLAAHIL